MSRRLLALAGVAAFGVCAAAAAEEGARPQSQRAAECARIETDLDAEEVRRELRPQSNALLKEYTWDKVVRFERAFYEWDGAEGLGTFPGGGGV